MVEFIYKHYLHLINCVTIFSSLLTRNSLLVRQPYAQKYSEHNLKGHLFHLPKYYLNNRPRYLVFTEKIVEYLKTKPNYTADYHELRVTIGDTTGIILKKLAKSLDFLRFVQPNVVDLMYFYNISTSFCSTIYHFF